MLKLWYHSTVRSMKNVAVLMEAGAFALFFFPTPGDWTAKESPSPGNLPRKAKKMLMSGGSTGMRGRRSRN